MSSREKRLEELEHDLGSTDLQQRLDEEGAAILAAMAERKIEQLAEAHGVAVHVVRANFAEEKAAEPIFDTERAAREPSYALRWTGSDDRVERVEARLKQL